MPRSDREVNIVPSLLDRLLDDAPAQSQEPVPSRSQNVRGLKASVARDLEALLNTRRETLDELAADWTETRTSLLTYGLPDFTAYSLLGEKDRARIRRTLEEAIAAFEPRLERVHITLDSAREHDRALRFRVDGLLRVDPSPEPVTFDTVLQLPTQQYVVRGDD
ncbi:MAG TPA: type VI secretion system baseplate subunit TssE [Methylomirabilota bacterium]|jgi:type VI secretion system protein ImpF